MIRHSDVFRFALTAALLLGLSTSNIVAQDELVTDRPDQTESAVTIAPGSVQIETGVLYTEDNSFEVTETLGTLVRIGLRDRFELRIGVDGFISTPGPDGVGDASIGVKFVLAEESANSPQIAVLVESSVPIGDDGLTSDDYAPAARLALSRSFGDDWGVGVNVGAEFPRDDEILFYTAAAGVSLDEKNGAFFELFGNSESSHSFDTGWTRLLRPHLQFDLAAGVGLSDDAADWFVGIGLSVRLPK